MKSGKVESVKVCCTDKLTLAHVAQALEEKFKVEIYRDADEESILIIGAKEK